MLAETKRAGLGHHAEKQVMKIDDDSLADEVLRQDDIVFVPAYATRFHQPTCL